MSPHHLLRWYLEAGVDETIGEEPLDRYALSQTKAAAAPQPMRPVQAAPQQPAQPVAFQAPAQARASASQVAAACKSLHELKEAMEQFDGGLLKKSSQNTVFADGNPDAKIMFIGEAPGADEDRLGLPFVGPGGKLLDKMLASIGLDRSSAYLSNLVPWRPPGRRKPELAEIELCLPFVQRHIELVDPAILVFLGEAPASALLARQERINRLRGRWWDYHSHGLARPLAALASFNPDYLLGTPSHKREAWQDFLALSKRLQTLI